jgi:fibronectin type 3 domain-containing protein
MSDIIAVKRPDIVPPSAPVITDVAVDEKSVTVTYISSTSHDVSYHLLNRRVFGEEKWEVSKLSPKENIYVDKNVKQNVMYEYSIIAVDSSGLHSEMSFPVTARPYFSGVLESVKGLKVYFDKSSNNVNIEWNYEGKSEDIYFVIYRSYANDPVKKYKIVTNKSARHYNDNEISSGNGIYNYALKVFDKQGSESKLSEKVIVKINQ